MKYITSFDVFYHENCRSCARFCSYNQEEYFAIDENVGREKQGTVFMHTFVLKIALIVQIMYGCIAFPCHENHFKIGRIFMTWVYFTEWQRGTVYSF
jgi:hypothetical protein